MFFGRTILIVLGTGLIIFGYYQLFVVDHMKSYLGKPVTAITTKGAVSGIVIVTRGDKVTVSNNEVIDVPVHNVVKIEGLLLDEYEMKRSVNSVVMTAIGGILIWWAVFFYEWRF